jgi:hypothetical protein
MFLIGQEESCLTACWLEAPFGTQPKTVILFVAWTMIDMQQQTLVLLGTKEREVRPTPDCSSSLPLIHGRVGIVLHTPIERGENWLKNTISA